MRTPTATLLTVGVALVLIQLVPVTRDNPQDHRGPGASPAVLAVLHRACDDCHSHETVWPWYSRVAPVSWLVAHDVHGGREKFNLSTLQDISQETQVKVRAKALEEIETGEMPPWYYLAMHRAARLTDEDRVTLKTWR